MKKSNKLKVLASGLLVGAVVVPSAFSQNSRVSESIIRNPVVLVPAQNPREIPQAEVEGFLQDPYSATDEASARTSKASVERTANRGGVQQIVNIDTKANSKSDSKANADADSNSNSVARNRSELYNSDMINLLQDQRINSELRNNSLLLEQIEKDRLASEEKRRGLINDFDQHQRRSKEVVVQTVAPQVVYESAPTVHSSEPVVVHHDSPITEHVVSAYPSYKRWTLSPMVGKRWAVGSYDFGTTNQFMVGLNLSGKLTKALSIETSLLYGQDQLSSHGAYGSVNDNCGYYWQGSRGAGDYGHYRAKGYQALSYDDFSSVYRRDIFELNIGLKTDFGIQGMAKPVLGVGIGYAFNNYANDGYSFGHYQSTTNNFSVNMGAGVDVNISKSASLGARIDYIMPLNGNNSIYSGVYGEAGHKVQAMATFGLQF